MKKRNFNEMRTKASSQSTHIYLKNHSYKLYNIPFVG